MRRGQPSSHCRSVPGGRVTVHYPRGEFTGGITTEFDDGASCEGRDINHDLCHHFTALCLRWPFSRVLWSAAHGGRPEGWPREWPFRQDDEEHIVKCLQQFVATGQSDEVLDELWGHQLPFIGTHFSVWLRPWLAVPLIDLPLPLNFEAHQACGVR